jgi:pimeloyl-ACP methyl ester carboxylesterase
MFVDCQGVKSAAPTVILESGAFGTSADWSLALPDLARDGRVCAYDRAGVGASPPRPGPRDPAAVARELAALLDRLGETGPVILVGHSNGGLYVETFAALFPARAAGLVYVNAVTSNDLDHAGPLAELNAERRMADLAPPAGRLGLAPAVARLAVHEAGLEGEARQRKMRSLTHIAPLTVARDEDREIVPGLAATRALNAPLPAPPTVVIVSLERPRDAAALSWRRAEVEAGERARYHWVLDLPGATHVSPLARDRAYLVAGVDWLRSTYQAPTLGMDAQGSAGGKAPSF